MKRITCLLIITAITVIASTYTRAPILFRDTLMVGTDTLWSYPIPVERTNVSTLNGIAAKFWMYSNDTCIMDCYFKCSDTNDTLQFDSMAYSPTGAPNDSTVFTNYVVPTSAQLTGAPIWSDVTGYLYLGLFQTGEATDTVWLGPANQGATPKYRYLRIDYIGGN